MTTTVEVRRGGSYEAIDYDDFRIDIGVSDVLVAPEATVTTQARESIDANQDIRITIDGTVRFEGVTESSGTKRANGQVRLNCEHPAAALFEDTVTFTETGSPTDLDVLQAALANAERGGDFALSYDGSATALDSDYDADGRNLKTVFRDMMDRTSRVWWIDPATTTITVQPRGFRGTWQSLSSAADGISVQSFDEGSVDTVRNFVRVNATNEEVQSTTAEDSASVSEYGRRAETINIGYASTQLEALAMANELLIPDPLAEAEVLVPNDIGVDITEPLANYTVDVTDQAKNINGADLLIEQQTIEQGRVTLKAGEGTGVDLSSLNRKSKSQEDSFQGDELAKIRGTLDEVDDGQNFSRVLSSALSGNVPLLEQAIGDLDNIEDGQTFARVNQGNVDSNNFVLLASSVGDLDDIDDGDNFGKVLTTALDAGEIILSEAVGDLDDIENGSSFGKVSTTFLTPGSGVFAQGVELDDSRSLDDITVEDIDKGDATVIDGGEILTSSLTADEIDTLDLDTDQLSVTTPSGSGSLEFTATDLGFGFGDSVQIAPGGGASALLGGSGAAFVSVWTEDVFKDTDNSGSVGSPSTAFADMYAYTYNTPAGLEIDGDTIRTPGAGVGNSGVTGNYWQGVRSDAYFEESPEPLDGVDLDELCECGGWYDPPEYIRRESARKEAQAEGDGDVPADGLGDPSGLELGTVANYLLETCRSQQERINDLEARLSKLEQCLSDRGSN